MGIFKSNVSLVRKCNKQNLKRNDKTLQGMLARYGMEIALPGITAPENIMEMRFHNVYHDTCTEMQ
jgi:hypothetical protein